MQPQLQVDGEIFRPCFGAENIDDLDYFTSMRSNSFLWSYGCGSGTHMSSAGIGTTADFANDSLLTVFTMLFGSQFGDWDNDNNFLKAPLASGLTLSNVWAGNPPWQFHQMADGLSPWLLYDQHTKQYKWWISQWPTIGTYHTNGRSYIENAPSKTTHRFEIHAKLK